ncbi:hypothetical protein [Brevibacillus laterosporus]
MQETDSFELKQINNTEQGAKNNVFDPDYTPYDSPEKAIHRQLVNNPLI